MTLTITAVLALIALVLAAIDQWQAQGRSLLAWAVMILAAVFIVGAVPLR